MAAFSNTPHRNVLSLDVAEFYSDSPFSRLSPSTLPSDSPGLIVADMTPMATIRDGITAEKKRKNDQCNSSSSKSKKGKNAKEKANEKREIEEEPETGYIHVRARRGQATDSHSLAERARREKIRERMKMLQGLVPGCDKVIGKALLLEEIINYVQSLQNQVEFLSMKLASLNPVINSDGFILSRKSIREAIAFTDTAESCPIQDRSVSFPLYQGNGDGFEVQLDDNGEGQFYDFDFSAAQSSFL